MPKVVPTTTHTLLVGDALTLPLFDDVVDLVFTSPPYEDARTYGMDYSLKGSDWVNWCFPRYMECLRVCRGLVAWVVQGRTRNYEWSATPTYLLHTLSVCPTVRVRNPPIYHRVGIPGSVGPDWLRSDYEWVVCATRDDVTRLPWSDNVACGAPPKYDVGGDMSYRTQDGQRRNARTGVRLQETYRKRPPERANPGNVLHGTVGGGQMGHPLAHENEAPFPLWLAEFFVRSFCPPGGVVLDPMCGSGTVAHAAHKWGRNSISMDVRESQIQLTRRRLMDVGANTTT